MEKIRNLLYRGHDPYSFSGDLLPLDAQGYNSNEVFRKLLEIQPKLIIEVGTWKGLSALSMARAQAEYSSSGKISPFAFLYALIDLSLDVHFQVFPDLSQLTLTGSPEAVTFNVPSSFNDDASAACIITAEKYKKSSAFGIIHIQIVLEEFSWLVLGLKNQT